LLSLNIRRDALAQIRRARELCGDCPEALRGEVNFHLADGQLDAAAEALRALLARDPDPELRGLLSRTLWKGRDAAGVVAVLDTVPEAVMTAEELTLLLEADRELGRSERARRWVEGDADAVRRLTRPEDQAWALLAEICLDGGDAGTALVAVDRAIALEPETALYHHNRAAILVALGREAEARAALERAGRLDPRLGRTP
jgi:tetratricopeptide (TPR) repeat protein